jgi:hypothetical protein
MSQCLRYIQLQCLESTRKVKLFDNPKQKNRKRLTREEDDEKEKMIIWNPFEEK